MKRLKEQKIDELLRMVLYLVTFVSVSSLLYCAFFVYPSGDDYGYAYRALNSGFFESYVDTYLSWSGRYMASLFSALNPLLIGVPALFTVYSIVLILLFIASICFFIYNALYTFHRQSKILATSLLMCIIMAGMPSFFEFFYWFSAYISYAVPCVFILCFLGLQCMFERNLATMSKVAKISVMILASILIVMIVGCNELTLIAIDSIVAFVVFIKWRNKSHIGCWWWLLFMAGLSSAVMLAAPGNYARLDITQENIDYFRVLSLGSIFTVRFFLKNLPLLAVMSLMYIFIVAPHTGQRGNFVKNLSPFVMFVFMCVVVWLMHVFTFLSTDTCPLERTENVVFVFLVFSWFSILYLAVPNVASIRNTRQGLLSSCFVILLFLFFMFRYDSAINATFADILSGNVTQFAKERQNQIEMLKKSQSPQTVLPSLTVAPKTLTYTLYDEKLGLNVVILPGDEYYGSEAVFLVDTIRVQDSRVIWSKIKTDWKKRINR